MMASSASATAPNNRLLLASLLVVAAMAAILFAMGRVPICTCGTVKLWYGAVNTAENSQHIADWYTPSHIIHGMIFYGLLHWLARRGWIDWSLGGRFPGAVVVEATWEILENSPLIIERYRSATMAVGYTGDSIVNSVADVGWMSLGFVLAWRLPVRVTVALAIAFELLTLFVIRDNLTLNVLMLVSPIAAIRQWQAAL